MPVNEVQTLILVEQLSNLIQPARLSRAHLYRLQQQALALIPYPRNCSRFLYTSTPYTDFSDSGYLKIIGTEPDIKKAHPKGNSIFKDSFFN